MPLAATCLNVQNRFRDSCPNRKIRSLCQKTGKTR